MDVYRADNSVKNWRNLPISSLKPDLHSINAHTKFGENALMFTKLLSGNENTDGRPTDGRAGDWTDDGRTSGHPTWNQNTPPLSHDEV